MHSVCQCSLETVEGMSVQEAAEVLGSTPTAVKLRAFRAYEALREALGREREEGDHGA